MVRDKCYIPFGFKKLVESNMDEHHEVFVYYSDLKCKGELEKFIEGENLKGIPIDNFSRILVGLNGYQIFILAKKDYVTSISGKNYKTGFG